MKKIYLIVLSACLLNACSNIKKDYVVTDASQNSRPDWVKKEKKNSDKEFNYFVSHGNNINQRLCEKSAMARTSSLVAGEIATQINNAYTEISDNNNDILNLTSNEELKNNINLYLSGLKKEEGYWEKREYKKELGASEDKREYQCYVLMKMDKKTYNDALNLSIEKMLNTISQDEKQQLKEKLIENTDNE